MSTEEQGASTVELNKLVAAAEKKGWTVKGKAKRGPDWGAKRTGAAAMIRDYLRTHPDKLVGSKEMQLIVAARSPGIHPNAASSALSAMAARGEVTNPERGVYKWRGKKLRRYMAAPPTNGAAEPPQSTARPAHIAAEDAAWMAAGVSAATGDEALDADMAILDSALAALGSIESVVRRHRAVFAQLAALKRVLGG